MVSKGHSRARVLKERFVKQRVHMRCNGKRHGLGRLLLLNHSLSAAFLNVMGLISILLSATHLLMPRLELGGDSALITVLKARQTERRGLTVLASWGLANAGYGLVAASQTEGRLRAFNQMNAGWGAVNLAIALPGLVKAYRADPAAVGLQKALKESRRMEKILLFNAGLDVAYMLGGAYLVERAKRQTGDKALRNRGWGQSIALQGGALFVFDLGFFIAMNRRTRAMEKAE